MKKSTGTADKKRGLLSAALSIIITITMAGSSLAAPAAEDSGGGKSWYQPKQHAEIDYSEIKYEGFDDTRVEEAITELEQICSQTTGGKEERVLELYHVIEAEVDWYYTQSLLNTLTYYKDVRNEEVQEESQQLQKIGNEMIDHIFVVLKQAISSPYGDILRQEIGENGVEQLEKYMPMTDREFELSEKEMSLVQEYDQGMMDSYTAIVDGEEWTTEKYEESPPEDADENFAVSYALAKEKNSVLAEIYRELVQVRNEIAEINGYDNYADYAYDVVYGRDFTTEEIKSVYKEVKEKIPPLVNDLLTLLWSSDMEALEEASDGRTGEEILDAVEPILGEIDPALSEAFSYMRKYHFYDIEADDKKMEVNFTDELKSYGAPFIFASPIGNYGDYTTIIHEYGHYNEAYHNMESSLWEMARVDVFEIHSQGLEMLFYPYADDLFGDGGETFRYATVEQLISVVRDGCVYDEFQNTVYENPDMTVDELNQTFYKISLEYGYTYRQENVEEGKAYSWVEVPHTFESPMYYIGYATSALSAMDIGLEAFENRDQAIDRYMEMTALGGAKPYREAVKECGLKDVFEPGVISELTDSVRTMMDVDNRLNDIERTADSNQRSMNLTRTAAIGVIVLIAVLIVAAILILIKKKRKSLISGETEEKTEGKMDDDGTE